MELACCAYNSVTGDYVGIDLEDAKVEVWTE
jgi:hypothetical protein